MDKDINLTDINILLESDIVKNKLLELNILKEEILRQYKLLIRDELFINIKQPATIGNGIYQIPRDDFNKYLELHKEAVNNHRLLKFVPASGLATRMFQSLHSVLSDSSKLNILINDFPTEDIDIIKTKDFFRSIKKFPFYYELKNILEINSLDIKTLLEDKYYSLILEYLLTEKGLNYSNIPKAVLPFHINNDNVFTPIDEHLTELIEYSASYDKKCKIHLTVNEDYFNYFENKIKHSIQNYPEYKIDVSLSIQNPSFNTISIDENNLPVIENNGELFLRQGGHGALINNLNDLNADIIFIKNVDNVVPKQILSDTLLYKKLLCGFLVNIQIKIFYILQKIDDKTITKSKLDIQVNELRDFIYLPEKSFQSFDEELNYYFNILNRPLRVCGMVKNESEPGGGPFWVLDENNYQSLQIVEENQIEINKKSIFMNSTHFNPVDLVCGIKDYKGNNFNLINYVNHSTSLVSKKSKNGKIIKVLELPGLWNGSMFYWNTVFVEVPISTFNPVKTVFDLLRPSHRIVN